jgi:hypothetical protein
MTSLIKNKNNTSSAAIVNILTDAELELCARTVGILGGDQNDDIRSSLAWVIRNRIGENTSSFDRTSKISNACEAIVREALDKHDSEQAKEQLPDADLRGIREANYLVWNGKIMDQTRGATSCHRHDKTPVWSRDRTPTALLGAFLFFR